MISVYVFVIVLLIQHLSFSSLGVTSTGMKLGILVSVSSHCVETQGCGENPPQFGIWLYWSLSHTDIQCTHCFVTMLIIFILMNICFHK